MVQLSQAAASQTTAACRRCHTYIRYILHIHFALSIGFYFAKQNWSKECGVQKDLSTFFVSMMHIVVSPRVHYHVYQESPLKKQKQKQNTTNRLLVQQEVDYRF